MRKPNKEELEELKNYFRGCGYNEETAELMDNYWYCVFDDYISDCPAYAGKLLMAVYGNPEFYEVFIWDKNNKISRVEQDSGFKTK